MIIIKKINRIHERSLRTREKHPWRSEHMEECFSRVLNCTNDTKLRNASHDILSILNEKAIHQRCVNVLLTKVLEYLNSLFPELMN